jgi:hypothetical protein
VIVLEPGCNIFLKLSRINGNVRGGICGENLGAGKSGLLNRKHINNYHIFIIGEEAKQDRGSISYEQYV